MLQCASKSKTEKDGKLPSTDVHNAESSIITFAKVENNEEKNKLQTQEVVSSTERSLKAPLDTFIF